MEWENTKNIKRMRTAEKGRRNPREEDREGKTRKQCEERSKMFRDRKGVKICSSVSKRKGRKKY